MNMSLKFRKKFLFRSPRSECTMLSASGQRSIILPPAEELAECTAARRVSNRNQGPVLVDYFII